MTKQDKFSWVLPVSLAFLSDNTEALNLVRSLRWEGQNPVCPRCGSRNVTPINTNSFRELYRCYDCKYLFNSLAGTIFQRSKMPVNKFFQYFILHNAFGDRISLRDLCFTLNCSQKTASLWFKRGLELQSLTTFARSDRERAASLGNANKRIVEEDPFFRFCEMKGVLVNEDMFVDYIKHICQNTVSCLDFAGDRLV